MAEAPKPTPRRRRRAGPITAMWVMVALVAFVGLARFGVVTPPGRAFVESLLDGLKIGPYRRVHVDGLEGDVWGDFTIRRLTVNDVHGAWLDARQVRLKWNWLALMQRRFDVDEFDARLATVLRRPEAEPTGPAGGRTPVSLHIGKIATRLELLPAFSSRYGLYDVSGGFDLRRQGGIAGRAGIVSLTHAGDRVDADFDLGRDKTVRLALQAREANGGALAGALGLAPAQPFLVSATASGATSRGRFHIDSRSGPVVPIAADGAWTPHGGQAGGQIVLASSKYLTWYQLWFGPDMRFQVSGARAADVLQDVTLGVTSQNIDVSARGEADFGRQLVGPKGMQVAILARQGQRFLGFPQMGAARMSGTLSGRVDHWSLAGVLEADNPTAFDYKLAQVRGPTKFEWGGGQLAIGATMDGSGGAGRGIVAAALGGRPHATTQLVWLPDGHVLIKSLTVIGPGLKVDANGQRGILGGLTFKGQASFTNFAVAHPGAKGLMTTAWTASESNQQPWRFSFDAKATGLSTGWA